MLPPVSVLGFETVGGFVATGFFVAVGDLWRRGICGGEGFVAVEAGHEF